MKKKFLVQMARVPFIVSIVTVIATLLFCRTWSVIDFLKEHMTDMLFTIVVSTISWCLILVLSQLRLSGIKDYFSPRCNDMLGAIVFSYLAVVTVMLTLALVIPLFSLAWMQWFTQKDNLIVVFSITGALFGFAGKTSSIISIIVVPALISIVLNYWGYKYSYICFMLSYIAQWIIIGCTARSVVSYLFFRDTKANVVAG